MAIEIVDFPMKRMVDLSIAMLVHQRVLFDIAPIASNSHQKPRFSRGFLTILGHFGTIWCGAV